MLSQPPPSPDAPAFPPPPAVADGAPAAPLQLAPPRTVRDLVALRQRREDLSTQLVSAAGRREDLAEELRSEDVAGQDRQGLESRIRVLDERILQLESDIALTGRYVTNAPSELIATAQVSDAFGGLPPQGIFAFGGLFTLLVFAPLAFAGARLMWRRGSRVPRPSAGPAPDMRLDRIEQAVDAIAIEIERVAEGQRFTAKLLAESTGSPTFAAAARSPAEAESRG